MVCLSSNSSTTLLILALMILESGYGLEIKSEAPYCKHWTSSSLSLVKTMTGMLLSSGFAWMMFNISKPDNLGKNKSKRIKDKLFFLLLSSSRAVSPSPASKIS